MKLLCPKCKTPFSEHDEGRCPVNVSRRFFMGLQGSTLGAAALAKIIPDVVVTQLEASPLVLATPKVHYAASITLNVSRAEDLSGTAAKRFAEEIEFIGRREQRSVIGIMNGTVVNFYKPPVLQKA